VLDIDPEQTMALSPVLNIFGASVESIYIDAEGRLEMTLGGNDKITINPHKLYEAWELGLPDIFTLLVCVPGGRVTVFQKDKE